jgi:hypothetical protein
MLTRKETFSSPPSPRASFFLLVALSCSKLTSTLQFHYHEPKKTVSMRQVAWKCCYEPRGEVVYVYWLPANMNLIPIVAQMKIFCNRSGMNIQKKKFRFIFQYYFVFSNLDCFFPPPPSLYPSLFSKTYNTDKISISLEGDLHLHGKISCALEYQLCMWTEWTEWTEAFHT